MSRFTFARSRFQNDGNDFRKFFYISHLPLAVKRKSQSLHHDNLPLFLTFDSLLLLPTAVSSNIFFSLALITLRF